MKLDKRAVEAAADEIRPLFRHGGIAGGTGISYGWNAEKQGYGIWDHETEDWFPKQKFVKDIRQIDGPKFFAKRALRAAARCTA